MLNKAEELRTQVTFYLSDGNLRRDAFFREAIASSTDGSVPLELFLNCNRIKAITTEVEELKSALETCENLQLVDGGVRRMDEVDVEKLMSSTAPEALFVTNLWWTGIDRKNRMIEFLKGKFASYGDITYVDVATRDDKRIAGHAFVEFASEESVAKAVADLPAYPVELGQLADKLYVLSASGLENWIAESKSKYSHSETGALVKLTLKRSFGKKQERAEPVKEDALLSAFVSAGVEAPEKIISIGQRSMWVVMKSVEDVEALTEATARRDSAKLTLNKRDVFVLHAQGYTEASALRVLATRAATAAASTNVAGVKRVVPGESEEQGETKRTRSE